MTAISPVQLGSAALYGSAGLCLYLMLLNRSLFLLRDGMAKKPLVVFAFVAIVGGGIAAGLFLPATPWVLLPVTVLLLIAAGEMRRARIRRSCAGERPVDTVPHAVKLSSPVTTTDLVVHRYQVQHEKWQGERLRLVHVTDLHVHPRLPVEYYRRVFQVAEEARADLALLTGDFLTKLEALPILRQVLRPIASKGTFAVLGNHDYWTDPEAVGRVVREAGITLLTNRSERVTLGSREVMLTGYDYPWGTSARSIPAAADGRLHLVLSHTPDNVYRLARSAADFVFSGHNHAGQIRIPFLGPVVMPSVYGRRFDHGHFRVDGTHLFVAGGVGAGDPPIRIYCRPDIFVVDIRDDRRGASITEGPFPGENSPACG